MSKFKNIVITLVNAISIGIILVACIDDKQIGR